MKIILLLKICNAFGNKAENLLLPSPKALKNFKCCRRQCLKFFTTVNNRKKKNLNRTNTFKQSKNLKFTKISLGLL